MPTCTAYLPDDTEVEVTFSITVDRYMPGRPSMVSEPIEECRLDSIYEVMHVDLNLWPMLSAGASLHVKRQVEAYIFENMADLIARDDQEYKLELADRELDRRKEEGLL